jgi:Asp-tRNA(Asn)/Glu-tRNA(Gln) amidotransferase A subunit family amidase
MRNCVANWHCVFAERIEKDGAILLGKKQPDPGLRGVCDNFLFGPSRNPFAGGSSAFLLRSPPQRNAWSRPTA